MITNHKRMEAKTLQECKNSTQQQQDGIEVHYYPSGELQERRYWLDGKLHRDDDPAYEWYYKNGNVKLRVWYNHGARHRDNGPAVEYYDENGAIVERQWYKNGELQWEIERQSR